MLSMAGLAGKSSEAVAMAKFPSDAPEVVVVAKCPPLKQYETKDTSRAAKEMQTLRKSNPDAFSPTMFRDYGTLRAQCRAFEQAK